MGGAVAVDGLDGQLSYGYGYGAVKLWLRQAMA